jgi:hypothetical protein
MRKCDNCGHDPIQRDKETTGPCPPENANAKDVPMGMKAYRSSAKMCIEDRIFRLRSEAESLEALLRSLPLELPDAADEGLYRLANSRI